MLQMQAFIKNHMWGKCMFLQKRKRKRAKNVSQLVGTVEEKAATIQKMLPLKKMILANILNY